MNTAQCLCGQVHYQISGDLGRVRYCHCQQCRRANGSAFSANAKINSHDFAVSQGSNAIKEFEQKAGVFRAFCANCGSPLYARLEHEPDFIRIRLGALEGDISVNITANVWLQERASWFTADDKPAPFDQACSDHNY